MSAEYEDVLTNQPVVIDNVRVTLRPRAAHLVVFRAQALSRLDLLARIMPHAIQRVDTAGWYVLSAQYILVPPTMHHLDFVAC